MNKEDVIKIASKSKNEGMEKQVISRGYHISSISMGLGILLIMFLRDKQGDQFSQDLLFLMMLQLSTLSFYQFIKIKDPVYLLTGVIACVATIMTFINTLTYYGFIQ